MILQLPTKLCIIISDNLAMISFKFCIMVIKFALNIKMTWTKNQLLLNTFMPRQVRKKYLKVINNAKNAYLCNKMRF